MDDLLAFRALREGALSPSLPYPVVRHSPRLAKPRYCCRQLHTRTSTAGFVASSRRDPFEAGLARGSMDQTAKRPLSLSAGKLLDARELTFAVERGRGTNDRHDCPAATDRHRLGREVDAARESAQVERND